MDDGKTQERALLLDIDDTLLITRDSLMKARADAVMRLWGEQLNYTTFLLAHKILETWQRLTWYFSSDDLHRILPIIAQELDLPIPTVARVVEIEEYFVYTQVSGTQLQSSVLETLTSLRRNGWLLAVVSNGNRNLQLEKLNASGLSDLIPDRNVFVAPPGSIEAKPNPNIIQRALNYLGIGASSAVTVGDRATDIIAAKLAGTKSILFVGRGPEVKLPPPTGTLRLEVPDSYVLHWREIPSKAEALID